MSTSQERREIYATPRWRALRAKVLLAAGHRCERCRGEGRRIAAALVHHRKPIRKGGEPFAMENLEAICRRCHDIEHADATHVERAAWDRWLIAMVNQQTKRLGK